MLVRKYPNRRLYDTEDSRYITLDELAEKVRRGREVLVQDAETGQDLTQATLTQIILESRGGAKLLPVSLLMHLVRLDDDALGEFFGRYLAWSLELYLAAKAHAAQVSPFPGVSPFGPFAASGPFGGSAFGRMFGGPWAQAAAYPSAPTPPDAVVPPPPPPPAASQADDVAALRRELDELRRAVTGPAKGRGARKRPPRGR